MTDVEQPIETWDDNVKKMTVVYKGETEIIEAADLNEAQNKANDWLRGKGADVHG